MATILMIEDTEGVQRYISRIIEGMGHTVRIAEEGEKGYEMAQDPEVSVILTDLSMPGALSEMALVRKLREARPDCPIVVCSGYPTQERIEECEQLGITDFLAKPFEVSFIRSVISKLLEAESGANEEGGKQDDS